MWHLNLHIKHMFTPRDINMLVLMGHERRGNAETAFVKLQISQMPASNSSWQWVNGVPPVLCPLRHHKLPFKSGGGHGNANCPQ